MLGLSRRLMFLTWAEFDGAVGVLADRVATSTVGRRRPFAVYGQPRGGLVLATALSHRLGLPMVASPAPGMLWVDDIVDSGRTLSDAVMAHDPAVCATWLWNLTIPPHPHCPCLGVQAAAPAVWYVFPWESKERAEADHADYVARHERLRHV